MLKRGDSRSVMSRHHAAWLGLLLITTFVVGCIGGPEEAGPAEPQGLHTFGAPSTLEVSSDAFNHGASIPPRFTCDGENVSPPLAIGNVPPEAQELAIVMYDVDAPEGGFLHWALWGLPPTTTQVPAGAEGLGAQVREGTNDAGGLGYTGPCPPSEAASEHRYHFRVYALGEPANLTEGASYAEFQAALEDKVLAYGEEMGRYQKR